jgi:hypothetical protein
MATAAAKKVAPPPRRPTGDAPAPKPATQAAPPPAQTSSTDDSGEILETTDGAKIQLEEKPADDDLVTVVVPRAFTLTRDDHTPVAFPAGIQEMPRAYAAHWYAQACGVVIYEPKKA